MDSASRIKSKFISRNNVKRKFQTFNDAENSITNQWYPVVTADFTGNFTISWSGLKKQQKHWCCSKWGQSFVLITIRYTNMHLLRYQSLELSLYFRIKVMDVFPSNKFCNYNVILYLDSISYDYGKWRLDNTEGAIKNRQSKETGNTNRTRRRKNKPKAQHNMCWTPLYANKHK